MEELESALKKYNMGDEKTIKEIIAEVDTDNVLFFFFLFFFSRLPLYLMGFNLVLIVGYPSVKL